MNTVKQQQSGLAAAEKAKALGFDSLAQCQDHQKWLVECALRAEAAARATMLALVATTK